MKRFTRYSLLLLVFLIIITASSCELITPKPESPTIHALYIALDYKNTTIGNLNGTIPDAKEFASAMEALADHMGNTLINTLMLQEGSTRPYTNQFYPTRLHILSHLDTLATSGEIKPHDIFLLYYSGHGIGSALDTENPDRGNLVVAKPNASKSYEEITVTELQDALAKIPGTKILLIDACYSGHYILDYPRTMDSRLAEGYRYDANLYYLLASSDTQLSYESDINGLGIHGYFTYYLLESLGWDHSAGSAVYNGEILTQVAGSFREDELVPTLRGSRIVATDIFSYIVNKLKTKHFLYTLQNPQTGKGPKDLVLFDKNW